MIKRLAQVRDAPLLSYYYTENAEHLQPWEPDHEDDFHALEMWYRRLAIRKLEQREGRAAHFIGITDDGRHIIATCSLTNIARGAFQAGVMGYSVGKEFEGQGYMRELCEHVISFAFNELALHRIMANYVPRNARSERLLQRLGFVREGLAKDYLRINGRWEDHVLTSLINPRYRR